MSTEMKIVTEVVDAGTSEYEPSCEMPSMVHNWFPLNVISVQPWHMLWWCKNCRRVERHVDMEDA